MTDQKDKASILSFNRITGYYEGTLLIQVDAEIFRRMLLKAVEEDETADLTDPQTWVTTITRVGKITNWLDRPHVKVTPTGAIAAPMVLPLSTKPSVQQEEKQTFSRPKTQMERIEERLRTSVKCIAPYLWEERCLTPIGDHSLPDKERADIGRLRYDERKVLKKLREEWKCGKFILDSEATEQERVYQERQHTSLNVQLEAVASLVNESRFH